MQPINKPPLKLLFGTPEFIDGIQTTVRVGVKWRDLVGTKRLKNVPVFVTGEQDEIGRAEITGTLFGQFRELASVGSKFNHQENCRTVKGLAKVLAECYPYFDPETSQVTVVFFKFTAPEPIVEEAEERVSEDADGNTLEPEVDFFPEDGQPVPPLDGPKDETETETVEETEESDDDTENDSGEEISNEETSSEETTDGSSEESSAED